MILRGPASVRGCALLVAPLPRRAGSLLALARPSVVVFITDLDWMLELPPDDVRRLWGLTPAEARLALLLAQGGGINDAAAQLRIAQATARAQLAAVFRKTGAQADRAGEAAARLGPGLGEAMR